jgi:AraC-like DNA-binding protein
VGRSAYAGYRHSARFIRPFARVLRRYPSIPTSVVDGLESIDLDHWITYSRSAEFCDWALLQTRDENLGLHAAEAVQPGDFDVLEYAGRSCATIGEAIEVVNRYIALLRDGAEFHLDRHGARVIWNLTMAIPLPRILNDWTVAVYVVLGRTLIDDDYAPSEVHVTHARPTDTSEYARILRAPVRFGQSDNRLIMPASFLDRPIRQADARLHAVMQRYAGQLLEQRPSPQRFSDRVRVAVTETLRSKRPAVGLVADRLHLSERTLRRRLQDEGTSFTDVVDDVRRKLALSYLDQPNLGLAEIAFMLGFSQTSAFSRAFKRWTGIAPIERRRQHLRPAS